MTLKALLLHASIPLMMLGFAVPAGAGRPLVTDDAGVIEPGFFELESYAFAQRERAAGRTSGIHLQPSVGIGLNMQLGVAVDLLHQPEQDQQRYAVSAKLGLAAPADRAPGLAIAASTNRFDEVGDGKGSRSDLSFLNAIVTLPIDAWAVHANLGWQHSRVDQASSTVWALALERSAVLGPLDLALESFGDDRGAPWAQLCARWSVLPQRLSLDASLGRQFGGSGARLLTVGIKLAY